MTKAAVDSQEVHAHTCAATLSINMAAMCECLCMYRNLCISSTIFFEYECAHVPRNLLLEWCVHLSVFVVSLASNLPAGGCV